MDTGTLTLESMNQASQYNKWILGKFKKYLKGDILEIGSGIGNFTKLLIPYGNVWASDISKEYVTKLKNEIPELQGTGIADIENAKYYFKNQKFDVIVCLNVVEHIKNDEAALLNIQRLLKPKGILVLIVPSGMKLYGSIDKSIGHFRRYSKKPLEKQLHKSGFKTLRVRLLNFVGGLGWFVAGKIFKHTHIKKGNVKVFNLISPLFLFIERFWEPPLGTSVFVIARKS